MQEIKNFWTDLRYSKMFPWIIAVIVLGAISFGLFLLDRGSARTINNIKKPTITQETLTKNFDKSTDLVKVSQTKTLYGFLHKSSDDKEVFLTKDGFITSTDSIIQSKNIFAPQTAFNLVDGRVMINQDTESAILDLKTGEKTSLPSSITFVTQVGTKFWFLQTNKNSYNIQESANEDLSKPKTIATFAMPETDYLPPQMRIFNNQVYILLSKITETGENLSIYSVTNGKVIPKLEIPSIAYKNYGYDKILVTSKTPTSYDNSYISFRNPEKLTVNGLDFGRDAADQGAKSSILASRCAVANGVNKITCLIKVQAYNSNTDFYAPDAVVDYNIDTKVTTNLYPNINISGHFLQYTNSDELYIFAQESNLLYKFK
jgi:hypothetical protein